MKVFGICGFKNSGKTTLTAAVVKLLNHEGLQVAVVKHASPRFDTDKAGKDSHTHRRAGAKEVLVASDRRWALIHEHRDRPHWGLKQLLKKLSKVDLVLVEGFKSEPMPKLEVFRPADDRQNTSRTPAEPSIWRNDKNVRAIAMPDPQKFTADLPIFGLNRITEIAEFIKANATEI